MFTDSRPPGGAVLSLMVNGEARELPAPLTVFGLLEGMGLVGKRVAVERNEARSLPDSGSDQACAQISSPLDFFILFISLPSSIS